jgi:general stress protein 26
MPTEADIERRFWKALRADMTMMIGVTDAAPLRPMTAQIEVDRGPIWFFTSTESGLADSSADNGYALATFAAKGHELFARLEGTVRRDDDRAVIDRLWNRFIAAWYEGGKDDPKLVLLRFDADRAEVWLNESSLFTGIKLMLGMDPKESYKDLVADLRLSSKRAS